MGQYHVVYNVTRKEYFSSGGAKLIEKAYSPISSMALHVLLCNSNGRDGGDLLNPFEPGDENFEKVQKAIDKIAGRWAGHRIVVQGDLAEEPDKNFLSEWALKEYKDIGEEVLNVLLLCAWDDEFREQVKFEIEISQDARTRVPESSPQP